MLPPLILLLGDWRAAQAQVHEDKKTLDGNQDATCPQNMKSERGKNRAFPPTVDQEVSSGVRTSKLQSAYLCVLEQSLRCRICSTSSSLTLAFVSDSYHASEDHCSLTRISREALSACLCYSKNIEPSPMAQRALLCLFLFQPSRPDYLMPEIGGGI